MRGIGHSVQSEGPCIGSASAIAITRAENFDTRAQNWLFPNDHNHLHFGLGQTEARLDLPPGKHTLQLLLGDENHIPHQPPLYSKRITITVTP